MDMFSAAESKSTRKPHEYIRDIQFLALLPYLLALF